MELCRELGGRATGAPGPDRQTESLEMLLATELCFGILGRKQGRNPEANCGSVRLTYQLVIVFLLCSTERPMSHLSEDREEERRDTR